MGLAIKNESKTLECYVNQHNEAVVVLADSLDDVYYGGVFSFEGIEDLKSFKNILESVIKEMEDE